jgi:hypothetical protein
MSNSSAVEGTAAAAQTKKKHTAPMLKHLKVSWILNKYICSTQSPHVLYHSMCGGLTLSLNGRSVILVRTNLTIDSLLLEMCCQPVPELDVSADTYMHNNQASK